MEHRLPRTIESRGANLDRHAVKPLNPAFHLGDRRGAIEREFRSEPLVVTQTPSIAGPRGYFRAGINNGHGLRQNGAKQNQHDTSEIFYESGERQGTQKSDSIT